MRSRWNVYAATVVLGVVVLSACNDSDAPAPANVRHRSVDWYHRICNDVKWAGAEVIETGCAKPVLTQVVPEVAEPSAATCS